VGGCGMRAILMTAVGGPEVLKLEDLPEPQIASERDVLVRLRAAGVNPVDYNLRSHGTFGSTLPAILGWDGAGVVERAGPAVTRVRPGDEVYFCDGGFGPTPGTYAELKVVDERYLARKPERLSFVAAAAAPLVTITAWEALRERARVSADQTVLVQAGAGGVGHMSVQIARLAGARVATTVSPGAKTELAASLGAQLCIDYTREDVAAKLRAWTGTDGADVVHDTVGGKTFTSCFSLTGSASERSWSRRPGTSTPASCASKSARRSPWSRRPTRTARWKQARLSARSYLPCSEVAPICGRGRRRVPFGDCCTDVAGGGYRGISTIPACDGSAGSPPPWACRRRQQRSG
jgi:NADPH2:quinone reductase